MAVCRNCGEAIDAAARFCTRCGFMQPTDAFEPSEVGEAPDAAWTTPAPVAMPGLEVAAVVPATEPAPSVAPPEASLATLPAPEPTPPLARGVGVQPKLLDRDEWYVYRPPRVRAVLAQVALGLFILAIGICAINTGTEMGVVRRLDRGEFVSSVERQDVADNEDGAVVLYVFTFILAAGAFVYWLHRAYRNVEGLGAEGLRYSSGWAVGWFFVPVMNLFRPYQVMHELRRASDPIAVDDPLHWQRTEHTNLVAWWWAQWLIGSIAFGLFASVPTDDLEPSEWLVRDWLLLAADAAIVAAAILAMVVIGSITKRQERRAKLLGL